jgi:hypothetical protein
LLPISQFNASPGCSLVLSLSFKISLFSGLVGSKSNLSNNFFSKAVSFILTCAGFPLTPSSEGVK